MTTENQNKQTPSEPVAAPSSRVEELLGENLALTREIYKISERTRRYLWFAQVATIVKLILIVGPLILALIYLPPYFKQLFSAYQDLLGSGTGATMLEGNNLLRGILGGDLDKFREAQKLINTYQSE